MPRPRKLRRIQASPTVSVFKPRGVPMSDLTGVVLSHDAMEAIRLADAEGMEHESAAKLMDVSRPTFSRLLAEARRTVAIALTRGWALRIDGGDFRVEESTLENAPCPGPGRGHGRRRRCGHRADSQKEE